MKPTPCKLLINNRWGYVYAPVEFPSVNQAVKYGREFRGGCAWRLFDMDGKFLKRGFCDNTPMFGYHGI